MATTSSNAAAPRLLHAAPSSSSAAAVFLADKRHLSASFIQNQQFRSICLARQLSTTSLPSNNRPRRTFMTCESSSTSLIETNYKSTTSTTTTDSSSSSRSTTATDPNSSSYNNLTTFASRPRGHEGGVQELTVYEVNERDRDSPVLLTTSKLASDWYNRLQLVAGLGDLVPFTNKIFDGSMKKRLGITAGIISVVRNVPEEDGLLFESIYSFYFGDLGHISVKGPYKTYGDTILTISGGSGIFTGVYGTVKVHNVEYPIVLFYSFKLYGIPLLPAQLRWNTIPPRKGVRPSYNASSLGVALPNFTD